MTQSESGDTSSNAGSSGPPQSAPESLSAANPQVVVLTDTNASQAFGVDINLSLRPPSVPSPADMAAYRDVDPTYPNRLLAMAESQQTFLQQTRQLELQRRMSEETGNRIERRIGQMLAFGCVLICAGLCALTAYWGYTQLAGVVFGTTILGLVTAFIGGRVAAPRNHPRKPRPSIS